MYSESTGSERQVCKSVEDISEETFIIWDLVPGNLNVMFVSGFISMVFKEEARSRRPASGKFFMSEFDFMPPCFRVLRMGVWRGGGIFREVRREASSGEGVVLRERRRGEESVGRKLRWRGRCIER